jgi:hypothetical protein
MAADMAAYSHWQSFNDGDPTIWVALFKPGNRYRSWGIKCDKELIQIFTEGDGARQFVQKQKELLKSGVNDSEQKLSEGKQNGGGSSGRVTQGNGSKIGEREAGEERKVEEES